MPPVSQAKHKCGDCIRYGFINLYFNKMPIFLHRECRHYFFTTYVEKLKITLVIFKNICYNIIEEKEEE